MSSGPVALGIDHNVTLRSLPPWRAGCPHGSDAAHSPALVEPRAQSCEATSDGGGCVREGVQCCEQAAREVSDARLAEGVADMWREDGNAGAGEWGWAVPCRHTCAGAGSTASWVLHAGSQRPHAAASASWYTQRHPTERRTCQPPSRGARSKEGDCVPARVMGVGPVRWRQLVASLRPASTYHTLVDEHRRGTGHLGLVLAEANLLSIRWSPAPAAISSAARPRPAPPHPPLVWCVFWSFLKRGGWATRCGGRIVLRCYQTDDGITGIDELRLRNSSFRETVLVELLVACTRRVGTCAAGEDEPTAVSSDGTAHAASRSRSCTEGQSFDVGRLPFRQPDPISRSQRTASASFKAH